MSVYFWLMTIVFVAAGFVALLFWRRNRVLQKQFSATLNKLALTENKNAQINHLWRQTFLTVTEGLLVLDSEGRIQEANPAAVVMFGNDLEALIGRTLQTLTATNHPLNFTRFKEQLIRQSTARSVIRLKRPAGEELETELRGVVIADQPLWSCLVVLTDKSEHLRAKERLALLSQKVLVAQEEERARLSRELHDELGQLLTALRLDMDWLKKRLASNAAVQPEAFANTVQLVETATNELRRVCRGLRPPLLDDLGLEPAVRLLIREFEERTAIPVALNLSLEENSGALSLEVALCAYRIVQESITNVSRHAQAQAVRVDIKIEENSLMAVITDSGRGFDLETLDAVQGVGLEGMRERANLIGGTLQIFSTVGQGTRIVFKAPINFKSSEEHS